ncbi:unnamed protein product [Boreogadus saida]
MTVSLIDLLENMRTFALGLLCSGKCGVPPVALRTPHTVATGGPYNIHDMIHLSAIRHTDPPRFQQIKTRIPSLLCSRPMRAGSQQCAPVSRVKSRDQESSHA